MDTVNWQNKDRDLPHEEKNDIRSKLSGMHFAKEALDPWPLQALYCAEALMRQVDRDVASD